jgi:ATP-binding cassette subfamily F protein 3
METLMANEDFYMKSQAETAATLERYHALSAELEQMFSDWEKAGG